MNMYDLKKMKIADVERLARMIDGNLVCRCGCEREAHCRNIYADNKPVARTVCSWCSSCRRFRPMWRRPAGHQPASGGK